MSLIIIMHIYSLLLMVLAMPLIISKSIQYNLKSVSTKSNLIEHFESNKLGQKNILALDRKYVDNLNYYRKIVSTYDFPISNIAKPAFGEIHSPHVTQQVIVPIVQEFFDFSPENVEIEEPSYQEPMEETFATFLPTTPSTTTTTMATIVTTTSTTLITTETTENENNLSTHASTEYSTTKFKTITELTEDWTSTRQSHNTTMFTTVTTKKIPVDIECDNKPLIFALTACVAVSLILAVVLVYRNLERIKQSKAFNHVCTFQQKRDSYAL